MRAPATYDGRKVGASHRGLPRPYKMRDGAPYERGVPGSRMFWRGHNGIAGGHTGQILMTALATAFILRRVGVQDAYVP